MSDSSHLPAPGSPLPDDVSQLLPDASPTPVQELLRDLAKSVLAPYRISVYHTVALPDGLRLHLGARSAAGQATYGQLLLTFNRWQQWTGTTLEGRPTPLARTAARLLVPTNSVPMMPLW